MTDKQYLEKYLEKDKLEDGLKKLEQGVPVQYIVGNMDFYGFNLDIDSRVLIPRFETEELVEKTINCLKNMGQNLKIIDLGTGSGCIAVTIKKLLPNSLVTAVDISDDALEVAQHNAEKLGVDVTFVKSDMLNEITEKYDCIISNPPYIAYDEKIMDIVKNNEPHLALYASNDGLYFYEEILKQCSKNIKDNFLIAFEIGQTQGEAIKALAHHYLSNITVSIEQDMQGLDRFVFIKSNN